MHKPFWIFIVVFITLQHTKCADLTDQEVDNRVTDIVVRRNQPNNGPNTSFRFKNFIRTAVYPFGGNQQQHEDTLFSIRDIYANAIPIGLGLIGGVDVQDILTQHLDNTTFLNDKLLETEIKFVNQFSNINTNLGNLNVINYQAVIQNTTLGFRNLIGRVTLERGSSTGTVVPMPINGGGFQWKILTCAHVLEAIRLQDNQNELAGFTLGLPGFPPFIIPVNSITILKSNNRNTSFVSLNNGNPDASSFNTIRFPGLVNAIPRYDTESDLAICELGGSVIIPGIGAFNTQLFLNQIYPVINVQINNDILSFMLNGININFHTVNNLLTTQNLVVGVNNANKNNNFVVGYAGFNLLSQTLSTARFGNLLLPFLGANFIDPINHTQYTFFHDAPTFSGMSGGPIFNVDNINNSVSVYGIVKASYFNNQPGLCSGSFLQRNLLQ
jgi:hypothetical protein